MFANQQGNPSVMLPQFWIPILSPCTPPLLPGVHLFSKTRKAIIKRLAMLIRSMFRQATHNPWSAHLLLMPPWRNGLRRSPSRLQERRFADIALDILRLLIDFELRLGDFTVFCVALALRGCFGSLSLSVVCSAC